MRARLPRDPAVVTAFLRDHVRIHEAVDGDVIHADSLLMDRVVGLRAIAESLVNAVAGGCHGEVWTVLPAGVSRGHVLRSRAAGDRVCVTVRGFSLVLMPTTPPPEGCGQVRA